MAQLSRPRFLPSARLFSLPAGLCLAALFSGIAVSSAVATPLPLTATSDLATEFTLLPDPASAETWLAQNIPVGTALSDHPRFFAAAHEVFFDGEDNVLVFVYRSATLDRWVAWVSFDAERMGVIDTTATEL